MNVGMSGNRLQGCSDEKIEEGVFWMDDEQATLLSPSNIIGFYLRMIKSYLSTLESFTTVEVKPSLSKELEEDFSSPFLVVKRGNLTPANIGIMNSNQLGTADGIDISSFEDMHPDASLTESKVYSELVTLSASIEVYGHSTAEVERIGQALYSLIMGTGYDAMRIPFNFVIGVNPPTLTSAGVMEKHSEIYTLQILWSIDYRDDSILLIRKNVIKYATIIVREQSEERIIHRFDQQQ